MSIAISQPPVNGVALLPHRPRRGDKCPECGCHDTFPYADPDLLEPAVLICINCVTQEFVTMPREGVA